MIPLSIDELEGLALGELSVREGAAAVTGLEIDSRRVVAGDLFVAIGRGGPDYVQDALARGAAASLEPKDAHGAMATLAALVRSRTDATVVAITGSVGKTTTKDITSALCRPHRTVVAAEASYNNEVGLPLTLCRVQEDTELVILEMGMRGLGQVDELCRIARPDIGVITGVGPAHLEVIGSVDDVAQGKAELLSHLPAGGTSIVPAGESRLDPYLDAHHGRTLTFGAGGDVQLAGLVTRGQNSQVQVDIEGGTIELEFNFTGRHNVENALCAVAVYTALGLPQAQIGAGARAVVLSPLRSEEVEFGSGGLLLNDSYNANPMSMRAAIEHLSERAGKRRRVVVLGHMAELGDESETYHREIGAMLGQEGVDVFIGVGEHAAAYREGLLSSGGDTLIEVVETSDEAIGLLQKQLEPGDCVLVKASRAIGLEKVADAVQAIVA